MHNIHDIKSIYGQNEFVYEMLHYKFTKLHRFIQILCEIKFS